ncbi:thiamine pyrophosphate protein domain protein TPP-binding [Parvibaculum lavamentivorans DS-1]|uniref:Thiamine pyrophosphate protein domain protein TPP-binding n=1 Tax=Parvibaculum lavamentivorans (strain DS-1 / DSM 13023 / NCIMB 13966) TaxID=402881 RepID=A7HR45_PARL1|nr:acetolactate synthase large subunit [Parvibaculum lavamentivorans]ABS62378.1 thiamine pyrophosphate protein domain protein TPP-binding [Parvibaculum lavamentivorans DS-1]
MNGAESLVRTLVGSGVEVCFSNPGTSEMHFVAALDKVEGMRAILGLFEGAVTGMADGYGRMAEKPAATLLHLGPGLANGLANLHNARRAQTPIVNIVGDHATYHAQYDAPLASDIVGFARPVSGWVHSSTSPKTVAADGARAVHAAMQPPGQIATLILPADTAWLDAEHPAPKLPLTAPAEVSSSAVDAAAKALKNGKKTAILVRGQALKEQGLAAAGRIAAASGARIMCDTFAPRLQRGAGRVVIERIPYFAEQMVETLASVEQLILVGSKPPVSFFAYPGKPSWCTPESADIIYLAHPHEDGTAALEAVASAIAAPKEPANVAPLQKPDLPKGALDQFTAGQIIAHYLPDGAIISDEAATSGIGSMIATTNAAPHDHLSLTGGAIGQGLPLATGAAVACPDRKVVCLHGDGGAMYTLQSLWTQAREKLDVTNIIFANRSYAILNIELMRVGAENPGPKALSMLDLHNPELNWVQLGQGMGVESTRVETAEEFAEAFSSAMKQKGPRLIEVML